MNTTVNALKNLFENLGGVSEEVENISTIPDMIDKISDIAGEGGNPNYVETITGTLTNPFGERFTEIAAEAANNGVSLTLSFALVGMGNISIPLVYDPAGAGIFKGSVTSYGAGHLDSFGGMSLYFYPPESTPEIFAFAYENDTLSNITNLIASDTVSTTLTIIHHPLPETP